MGLNADFIKNGQVWCVRVRSPRELEVPGSGQKSWYFCDGPALHLLSFFREEEKTVNMEIEMNSLGRLDVEALKQLVALKENSGKLNRLETKRQRLKDELDRVEDQIREFLSEYPEVQGYLASTSGSMRRLTPSGRRPRGWIRSQVEEILGASESPLTPAEVRDEIARRHPEEATKNLYLAVFQHLRRHDEFEQDMSGRWKMKSPETA